MQVDQIVRTGQVHLTQGLVKDLVAAVADAACQTLADRARAQPISVQCHCRSCAVDDLHGVVAGVEPAVGEQVGVGHARANFIELERAHVWRRR